MNIFNSIFLGLVQGLTEFLPVSSSGHLVIVSKLLGLSSDVYFDVLLHFASLLAVCLFYAQDILKIIRAFLTDRKLENPYFKLGLLIIIASIPTAIIAFSFKDIFESMFDSLAAVGSFLLISGMLIMFAESYGKGKKDMKRFGLMDSLIIGVAQGCAVAPGLSRSGTTISTSLLVGLERPLAARFSFLLSIPAILGASVFKFKGIMHILNVPAISGFIAAALSSYIAIWLFIRLIEKKSIKIFAYYCFMVGAFVLFKSIIQ